MSVNTGLFVRPSKFRLTNPLQILAVANHVSSQLGGSLHFHFPREPEQLRPLSYGIIVPRSPAESRRLLAGNSTTYIKVPLSSSLAETSSNKSKAARPRQVGLRDVAPFIGLQWHSAMRLPGEPEGAHEAAEARAEDGEEPKTWIEVKLERAKGRYTADDDDY